MLARIWVVVLCLCLVPQIKAEEKPSGSAIEMSRGLGWHTYNYMNSRLGKLDPQDYPGIRGWLQEYQAFGKDATAFDPKSWPQEFDFDKVVLSSPKFWQATCVRPRSSPTRKAAASIFNSTKVRSSSRQIPQTLVHRVLKCRSLMKANRSGSCLMPNSSANSSAFWNQTNSFASTSAVTKNLPSSKPTTIICTLSCPWPATDKPHPSLLQ